VRERAASRALGRRWLRAQPAAVGEERVEQGEEAGEVVLGKGAGGVLAGLARTVGARRVGDRAKEPRR
jgi:hypothetical protein